MAVYTPTYKFVLANSTNLSAIGELTQARNRSFSVTLNRAGSASFTLPMTDDMAISISPMQSALRIYRLGSTGAQEIWNGYCATIEENASDNSMTCNFVGWLERYNKLFSRFDLDYTGLDDAVVIQRLTDVANTGDSTVDWPPSSPNTATSTIYAGTLPDQGSGGATAYTGSVKNFKFTAWTPIGQCMQQVIDVENGPDVYIEPATRSLYVQRRRRRILSGVSFGFGWGPNNIAQFSRTIDSTTIANWVVSFGDNGAGNPSGGAFEAGGSGTVAFSGTQSIWWPAQEAITLSGVTSTTILRAYSEAEIAVRSTPRQIFNVTPFPWTSENSSLEPFVDYRIGDQIQLVADPPDIPRLNVNVQVRVFGIQVNIDDEGNEILGQLQLSPGS